MTNSLFFCPNLNTLLLKYSFKNPIWTQLIKNAKPRRNAHKPSINNFKQLYNKIWSYDTEVWAYYTNNLIITLLLPYHNQFITLLLPYFSLFLVLHYHFDYFLNNIRLLHTDFYIVTHRFLHCYLIFVNSHVLPYIC